MPENFNSPSRVLLIMSEAGARDNRNAKVVDVWGQVFDVSSTQSREGAFQVVRKLKLLWEELDRCDELAIQTGVQKERYEGSIGNMRNVIDLNSLGSPWGNYIDRFNSADVNVLGFISDLVPSESVVDEHPIKEFSEGIEEFKDHVANLEDSLLRDFAAKQIAHMEQAISDYPIIGVRAFEQGVKDFAGEGFFNYNVWKENEDTETIEKMRNLGGKLFNIVKYTAPFIQAGAGMSELLGF